MRRRGARSSNVEPAAIVPAERPGADRRGPGGEAVGVEHQHRHVAGQHGRPGDRGRDRPRQAGAGRTSSVRTSCRRSTAEREAARRRPAAAPRSGSSGSAGIGASAHAEDLGESDRPGWSRRGVVRADPQDVRPIGRRAIRRGRAAAGAPPRRRAGRRSRPAASTSSRLRRAAESGRLNDERGAGGLARLAAARCPCSWRAASAATERPIAAARQGVDRVRGGEAGLEDEAQAAVSRVGRLLRAASRPRRAAPWPRCAARSGPGPSSATVTGRRAAAHGQLQRRRARRSGLPAARRTSGLRAVAQGVAQGVQQRVLQGLQQAAVDRQVEAAQVEIDVAALLPGGLADRAGEGRRAPSRPAPGRGARPRARTRSAAPSTALVAAAWRRDSPRPPGRSRRDRAASARSSGCVRIATARQRLGAGAACRGPSRARRARPSAAGGLRREGAGQVVARPGQRLHGLAPGTRRSAVRTRRGSADGVGGPDGSAERGVRRPARPAAVGVSRRRGFAAASPGRPRQSPEGREGVGRHVRPGPVLEAGDVGLDPVEGEVDGVGRLAVEGRAPVGTRSNSGLQPVGDLLHGRQIDGAGGALQAVGAAEDVVPVRVALARARRRIAVTCSRCSTSKAASRSWRISGHGARPALSAGSVRRGP